MAGKFKKILDETRPEGMLDGRFAQAKRSRE